MSTAPGSAARAAPLARGPVQLRPVTGGLSAAHWAALHRQARDPVVCDLNGYPPTPYPAWIFRWLAAADARRRDRRTWAILPADQPETCVGLVELYDLDMQSRRGVLGIVIGARERWGQGLGSAAVALVCEFGFEALGLEEIRLSTFAHNSRARRCFERTGFLESGRGPGPGGRQDVHMRLERPRWQALRSRTAGPARAG